MPALAKPAALAAVTNLIATLPAHAEAGKIFDFNLTLPIMVTEFLLLMVFLEKTWFTPVGDVLDKRDKALREKLGSVKVQLLFSAGPIKNRQKPKSHDLCSSREWMISNFSEIAMTAKWALRMQDNSSELEALQKEAEEVIAKARSEASAKIQAAKKATEEEIQAAADEHKKVSKSLQ